MSSQRTRMSSTPKTPAKRARTIKPVRRVARLPGTVIPRPVGGFKGTFPQHFTVTHKFSTTFNLVHSAGNFLSYNFSANGMNDCDITSVGAKQPLYFNTLAGIYDHYVVVKSKAKFTAWATTPGTASVIAAVFLNDDATTTPGNVFLVADQTLATQPKPIIPSTQPTYFYMAYDANKQFGPGYLGQDRLTGSGTSVTNPTETSIYTYCSEASLSAASSTLIMVEIEYTAMWSELKDRVA